MFFWRNKKFLETRPAALPPVALRQMSDALLNTPYLRQNVLNSRFSTTLGFSVIYRQPQNLLGHFGELEPFIDLLEPAQGVSLFYLNVLVIGASGKVERHVDHSIRGYDSRLPLPWRVSVLYLDVPQMDGGELLLYADDGLLQNSIVPSTGLLVHFAGQIKHAVAEIRQAASPRVSLVCEQYRLNLRQLKGLPDFSIKSMAPFQAYLDDLR
ncbi:MAG: hypothetical protein CVV27_15070 [Candidatus Melainabacteria bacterium HGW-Melainabacteria-1]|nr:MAG: hypothetical protein CVV27_15070 [Candidatus Melainabacteria bacterium HGW-Melainabacteria-1]